MKNYKTRIAQVNFPVSGKKFAYWHKKTISKEMYEKRSAEIAARRKSL